MYHVLDDNRIQCLSIMTSMEMSDYLRIVQEVYMAYGGLEGQRGPLKTKTGVSIRSRMVSDIQAGAVLPPVVVGLYLDKDALAEVKTFQKVSEIIAGIRKYGSERVSIIDGMQRTTAMIDAIKQNPQIGHKHVRVEFWASEFLNSLIYRMLILNTGQVPWELSRQIETVYRHFLKKIRDELGGEVEIFLKDEKRRRSVGGQYQSGTVIELFLLFCARKSELDIKDKVAEDFARLDAIETTAHLEFLDYFIETLRIMAALDKSFSRYVASTNESNVRFEDGKDIFASFPAMAGFVSAVSISVFDEPGFPIPWEEAKTRMADAAKSIQTLTAKVDALAPSELEQFLQIQLLEERLSQRSGQVGRFEREFFRRAFSSALRLSSRLNDMAPCWRA